MVYVEDVDVIEGGTRRREARCDKGTVGINVRALGIPKKCQSFYEKARLIS